MVTDDRERLLRSREALRKMDEVELTDRRRRFRETTPEQRLQMAFELSDFAQKLRRAGAEER